MLTLDTSAVVALFDARERGHRAANAVAATSPQSLVVPAGILAEIAYLAEQRRYTKALDGFLESLGNGMTTLDCGDSDFARIRALTDRYADLPLGFSDACVIACAERNGGRVLTLDRRDFDIVAREGTFTILP